MEHGSTSKSINSTPSTSNLNKLESTHSDVTVVMEQCGVSMETASELLNKANGDLIDAIAYYLKPELATSQEYKEAKEWTLVGGESDDEIQSARIVQDKLKELREITTAKNAIFEQTMRKQKEDLENTHSSGAEQQGDGSHHS